MLPNDIVMPGGHGPAWSRRKQSSGVLTASRQYKQGLGWSRRKQSDDVPTTSRWYRQGVAWLRVIGNRAVMFLLLLDDTDEAWWP